MLMSYNTTTDGTGNFHHKYVPRQPVPIQPKKKAYITRQVQPIHDNVYITIKLSAVDETGDLLSVNEVTKQGTTPTSAIREATFDFVHELEKRGYECTVR